MRPTLPPLADLALSRTLLDRAAHRREQPDLLPTLLADPATATVVVAGAHALVERDAVALALLEPATAASVADEVVASGGEPPVPVFLGQDPDGRAYVALLVAADGAPPTVAEGSWAGLREVGQGLDDVGVAALTSAVALGFWHAGHPRCSACGAATTLSAAGWSRECPSCGRTHFPRTDPAVIMAVEDDDGRLLLGRQGVWQERRYSTLAGFVEAGESLEAAVRREVAEECGVRVGEVAYQGSQPWPFPCSLMLGFSARALSIEVRVDGVELEHAAWWSREELAADVAAGRVLLPPGLSIARRLIEQWFGGPITGSSEGWA